MSGKNNGKNEEKNEIEEFSTLEEIFRKYGECLGKIYSAEEIGAEKLFLELEELRKKFAALGYKTELTLNKRKRYATDESVAVLRVFLPKGKEDDDVYARYSVDSNGRIVERVGTGDAAYLPSLERNLAVHVRRMMEAHRRRAECGNLYFHIPEENLEKFSAAFARKIFSEPDESEIPKVKRVRRTEVIEGLKRVSSEPESSVNSKEEK